MVSTYAGSKDPSKMSRVECFMVQKMDDSDRWYLFDRLYDKSVIKVYSSSIWRGQDTVFEVGKSMDIQLRS